MIAQAALVDLNKWRKQQTEEIKRKEKLLADQMKAAVPENLAKWLKADGEEVIKTLIEDGACGRNFYSKRMAFYNRAHGYTSLKEFAQRLQQLKEVWNHNIGIHVAWNGRSEIGVQFYVF